MLYGMAAVVLDQRNQTIGPIAVTQSAHGGQEWLNRSLMEWTDIEVNAKNRESSEASRNNRGLKPAMCYGGGL